MRMKSICFALLLLLPTFSGAADITVGDVSLEIPEPEGFSPVTPQMAFLYEIQGQFVAPMNKQFVAFIPDRYVARALKDDIPDMPRRFTVQTAKGLLGASVTTSDFSQLKNVITSQNEETMRRVEAEMPGLTRQMNAGIKDKYDVDLAFSISQMVPMPVHEDTDRTLAYSSLVKYDMQDEHGNPAPFIAVVTTTFVHVKGKVLFLYSYAEEAGLEWSKHAAQQWADAVVAANSSGDQASVREAPHSAQSGIDWGEVAVKAAIGAAVGLVIGLIGWMIRPTDGG